MKILDLSAGKRAVWFNRIHPDTIYVDIRPEVSPTLIADTRMLPFPDDTFNLIVFDPPHVVHGKNSAMAQAYGAFPAEEIRDTVTRSSIEAFRVSTPSALMAFKWNTHDVKLQRILDLMEGWEPLFGHLTATRTKHRSSTYWALLRKRPPGFHPVPELQRVLSMILDSRVEERFEDNVADEPFENED